MQGHGQIRTMASASGGVSGLCVRADGRKYADDAAPELTRY